MFDGSPGIYPAVLSVTLAALLSLSLPLLHVILLKLSRGEKAFLMLVLASLGYAMIWWTSFCRFLGGPATCAGACLGGLAMVGFFALGYAEVFSMICRGFSLRIMVDVYLKGAMPLQEIVENYGGQGMEWMMQKRLDTIAALGLVQMKDARLQIKAPWGTIIGKIALAYKGILNLGRGG